MEPIGRGTYGAVYRGTCAGQDVAVKVLPLQTNTAEDIKREIQLMRHCSCVNIVEYRDAFLREHEMRSTLWVVMELCIGGSTLEVMRRQDAPLREGQIAYICAGLLHALDYMHTEVKAIHRDIKAANVLLTADASVKLADLGVAAQLYSTMSKRGTMIGTPHWMAPETLGQNEQYDKKVDIWSLGITCIELAQMKPPLTDKTSVYQVMMCIVSGPPPTLAEETNASPLFRDFVKAHLIKDPAERPFAAELKRHAFVRGARPEPLRNLVQEQLAEKQRMMEQAPYDPYEQGGVADPGGERPRSSRAAAGSEPKRREPSAPNLKV
jgi:serine/threonine protein kinase